MVETYSVEISILVQGVKIKTLDVHFEAIHDHGDSGDACVDVGCGQGALVDGAELPHDPVEEEEIVRTHPDSGSEIQRED